MSEFSGVLSRKVHLINTVRAAFACDYKGFNVCVFHNLEEFDSKTFARWANELHCKNPTGAQLAVLKAYCVNYFICPEVQDEFELEAIVRQVFPPVEEAKPELEQKVVFKLGKWVLYKTTKQQKRIDMSFAVNGYTTFTGN